MARHTDAAYEEVVRAPGWMIVVVLTIAVFSGIGLFGILRDPTLSPVERTVSALAVFVAGFAVGVVGLMFSSLQVRADPRGVAFGFGPFRSSLLPADITGAEAGRYRWFRFGGWGLRWSWNLRDRAYSVPFVGSGVEIHLRSGRSFFISSRHPDSLAKAIEALRGGAAQSMAGL
ncbi:MAG: hypothetical protein U0360_10615 [Dehalococcoidia bacterium]